MSDSRRRQRALRFNSFIMGVGILCVMAAIVGGGVTLAGQEIHTFTSLWREVLLGVFGVALMAGSLVLRSEGSDGVGDQLDRVADETAVSDDGTLTVELDTESETRVLTFLGAVREAMRGKSFRDPTVTRVRLVLNELLTNVARHASDRTARVTVSIQEQHLRVVSVAVCDRGPGINPQILESQDRRLVLGEAEHEHGLMLAKRLATRVAVASQTTVPKDPWHCVTCEIIEPPLPTSMLFEFRDIAWVRMEYAHPSVYWLGAEYYVDTGRPDGIVRRLRNALAQGWRPILDLYLKQLTDPRYGRYLVVEAAGDEIGTHMVSDQGVQIPLREVLEYYFADHFRERRVFLLASDASYEVRSSVAEWAKSRRIEYFDSGPACRARLKQLSR